MNKITVLLVVFLSWVDIVHAEILINEFVSNSGDSSEWIEIVNTSKESVDLTGWKLSDNNKDTKDDIVLKETISGYGFIVSPHSSGWLNNDMDEITLTDDSGNKVDSIFYGNGGDIKAPSSGKSGALVSGSWVTNQEPTKGYKNSEDSTFSSNDEDNNTAEEEEDKENKIIFKVNTKIISPKIVTEGIPFSLSSLTTSNTGKTYAVGRFVWNLGDGGYLEMRDLGPFEYVYDYPGDYVLNLSYFDNSFNELPDATDKIIIKVIPSDIYISSVGDYVDPYIELENKSKYEVSLSSWSITSGEKSFIFKDGSILMQGKKLKLSPKLTGFNGDDIKNIILTNPSKEIVASYPVRKTNVSKITSAYSKDSTTKEKSEKASEDSNIINLNNLGASVSDSGIDTLKPIYYILGLVLIIGLGFVSFLFLKKKKDIPDYVEKGLSAKDMTIIE